MTLVARGLIRAPTVVGASRLRVNKGERQCCRHASPSPTLFNMKKRKIFIMKNRQYEGNTNNKR